MTTKKYMTLERVQEYDVLIKAKIDSGDSSTLSSANQYTDEKVSSITTGNVVVKEAEHATSASNANTAETANSATMAETATKATQDASGNVITDTYETKIDASAKLTEAKSYTDTEIANHTHSYDELNIQFATDDDVINALVEIGALSAITDNDGSMIADENNNILMW